MSLRRSIRIELAARAAAATRNETSSAVQRTATHRIRNRRAATATRNATSSAVQRHATHRIRNRRAATAIRNATSSAVQRPRGGGPKGRLVRELKEIMLNPTDGCHVKIVEDDITHWHCIIHGPSNSPYEGGHFKLDVLFPDNYPYVPPHVQFTTQIYHCNITSGGHICLDILSNNWSPILTADKVLLSIMSLLADPNPDDPMEIVVANMYKRDREQHDRVAREWTTLYAMP
ncbi:ubiquitin-conjugating enzyme E2 D4-like [Drosophila guanche]|uniref:ubiquitin-conjugating enzyme E2 D4-like n=1 Tax=Drosophila guanche TaxID=7266 RepID=UPI0014723CA7|nr:ubiquitin-conjugating enzyme E2 D4-like [Drosophila guanche]XP_034140923.1 ubiquitin-conjugating enzyme E2 D4-like [Drosophila guanche]